MTWAVTMSDTQARTISKTQLKARMLEVFRELEQTGEEILVTDHGRPVLRISPLPHGDTIEELFGPFQGKVGFVEDPDTPTSDEWAFS